MLEQPTHVGTRSNIFTPTALCGATMFGHQGGWSVFFDPTAPATNCQWQASGAVFADSATPSQFTAKTRAALVQTGPAQETADRREARIIVPSQPADPHAVSGSAEIWRTGPDRQSITVNVRPSDKLIIGFGDLLRQAKATLSDPQCSTEIRGPTLLLRSASRAPFAPMSPPISRHADRTERTRRIHARNGPTDGAIDRSIPGRSAPLSMRRCETIINPSRCCPMAVQAHRSWTACSTRGVGWSSAAPRPELLAATPRLASPTKSFAPTSSVRRTQSIGHLIKIQRVSRISISKRLIVREETSRDAAAKKPTPLSGRPTLF